MKTQMKEKKESPENELNEMEASSLSDMEFKAMVMKMLKEHNENYSSMKGEQEPDRNEA